MNFEPIYTVNNAAACLFKAFRPVYVIFFIKARFQFYQNVDLFAVFGSFDQRFYYLTMAG